MEWVTEYPASVTLLCWGATFQRRLYEWVRELLGSSRVTFLINKLGGTGSVLSLIHSAEPNPAVSEACSYYVRTKLGPCRIDTWINQSVETKCVSYTQEHLRVSLWDDEYIFFSPLSHYNVSVQDKNLWLAHVIHHFHQRARWRPAATSWIQTPSALFPSKNTAPQSMCDSLLESDIWTRLCVLECSPIRNTVSMVIKRKVCVEPLVPSLKDLMHLMLLHV